jgi:hypothetical protein
VRHGGAAGKRDCSALPAPGVGGIEGAGHEGDPHHPDMRSWAMYLARFSYELLPLNRARALDFIRREVAAAKGGGLNARLLVPLTRGRGDGAALQFEVELTSLDQLDRFRNRGIGSGEETGDWMHAFSEVLTAPPCVEILHVDDGGSDGKPGAG